MSTKQATLDLAGAGTGDDFTFLDFGDDVFPVDDVVSLLLADRDEALGFFTRAALVFELFNQDANFLAHFGLITMGFPFRARNGGFTFETDVDDDNFCVDLYDLARDNFVDGELLVAIRILGVEGGKVFREYESSPNRLTSR
jgi:hypothetical protein